ncbi:MAG: phospholipase D family protein [Cyclobacteriaceae bacterium]|nr:phospholipase D family protein [Cyclobacteriaceae bacterium]
MTNREVAKVNAYDKKILCGNRLMLRWALIALVMFESTCSSKESVYPPIDEDFCAQIHFDGPHGLADQLAPFSDLSTSKTGVYSLEEGDNAMIARAWLCESAEETIDIQYFIFSPDNVGLIAVDYLLRAAERGVKVRILIDDVMVEADADELLALDAHPNLSIRIYNPTANIGKNLPEKLYSVATNFRGFNQRMHNKTCIVDGKVVITGGRNIADEYFDYDHEYNFRDRDVLLIGKASKEVENSFNRFWNSSLSVPIASIVRTEQLESETEKKFEYVHQYACNPSNFWPQVRDKIRSVPIAFDRIQASGDLVWVDSVSFISDIPGKNDGEEGLAGGGVCTDALISLIRNAKVSICIQSPYLITTDSSRLLFSEAVRKGVMVKILTNSLASTDNLEAFSGYRREREALLNIGVNIYEFKPNAAIRYKVMTGALQKEIDYAPIFGLHAKSMVIDKEIAVIGTFNLDPRSANLNTECVAVIYDAKIAGALFSAMEQDMKPENAWNTTLSFNPDKEAGWRKGFKVWLRGVVPKSIL